MLITGSAPYYDTPPVGREIPQDIEKREREKGVGILEGERAKVEYREEESLDKVNISSKLHTIDYSHGSSYSSLKTVDYKHGTLSGPPLPGYREPPFPPPYNTPDYARHHAYPPHPYEGYPYPPGGGGYPPGPPGTFFPPGLDAATLFAAYASQAGTQLRVYT